MLDEDRLNLTVRLLEMRNYARRALGDELFRRRVEDARPYIEATANMTGSSILEAALRMTEGVPDQKDTVKLMIFAAAAEMLAPSLPDSASPNQEHP